MPTTCGITTDADTASTTAEMKNRFIVYPPSIGYRSSREHGKYRAGFPQSQRRAHENICGFTCEIFERISVHPHCIDMVP